MNVTNTPHPNYDILIAAARKVGPATVAVAHPCDRHTQALLQEPNE